MRLHFVTVPFPGVQRWLESGKDENIWGLTILKGGERTEVPAAETYGTGAWHPGYEAVYEKVRALGVPFGVAWSSSPQESDTERTRVELAYLMALTKAESRVKPDWWACLHPGLAAVLPNAVHLPAPIHLESAAGVTREAWIGMFLPPSEKKGIFSQLLAVRLFQKENPGVRLQTNLGAYKGVMDWLGLKYDLHPWLPRPEYLKLLARCRVVLHASLAESFGYGAVDALMMGTPVVGSPTMAWLPEQARVANPNDPRSVLRVLVALAEGRWVEPRRWVVGVAEANNAAAKLVVEEILGRTAKAK